VDTALQLSEAEGGADSDGYLLLLLLVGVVDGAVMVMADLLTDDEPFRIARAISLNGLRHITLHGPNPEDLPHRWLDLLVEDLIRTGLAPSHLRPELHAICMAHERRQPADRDVHRRGQRSRRPSAHLSMGHAGRCPELAPVVHQEDDGDRAAAHCRSGEDRQRVEAGAESLHPQS
jgi:hypothetical protein